MLLPGAWSARAEGVSVTLIPSFVSQYMFRGVRLGGPSFQPAVEIGLGSGALGVWSNFPLMDKVDGVSDPEIDPYGYYTITLDSNLSVVPGFSLYTYPRADKSAGFFKTSFEPSVAVNYTVSGVKLTPKLYYDIVLEGPTLEFAAARSVPLKEAGTSLDFAATVGTYRWDNAAEDTTPKLKNWGDYWQVGVSSPFALSKASTLTVGFAYTKGTGNYYKQAGTPREANPAAVGRGVVTLSYSCSF